MFSSDIAKLAVTFADDNRFYGNLVVCLRLDVTLSLQNLVKI